VHLHVHEHAHVSEHSARASTPQVLEAARVFQQERGPSRPHGLELRIMIRRRVLSGCVPGAFVAVSLWHIAPDSVVSLWQIAPDSGR
jgi:hypothetical protein